MRYLFLDNFRGFSNTSIPLVDVNFLVGENSTGKTSLLTMLKMFSGPELFMGKETATDDVRFGHFNEMVSAHSSDQNYFRLGLVDEYTTYGKKTQKAASGMLFTFKPLEGLSQISRFTCTLGDQEVSVNFQGEKIFYKTTKIPRVANASDMNKILLGWAKDHSRSGTNSGWKEIELPKEITKQGRAASLPLMMILAMAARDPKKKGSSFPLVWPRVMPALIWIAPIRSKPRRTYDEPQTTFSSEGSHTPYVIRRMLSSKTEAKKFRKFIERIGEASGLFQKIEIKYFGDSEMSPFEVDAIVDNKALSLGWLGYGVSQSLPIFVELLDRPRGSLFAIQQPEVHLHPRAQACLGDVFFEMAIREKKQFMVETHSDFTIDRFRDNYKRKRTKKEESILPESQVLFFERHDKHNTVTPLPIGTNGELPSNQPEGYRHFFIREEMQMLGLK